VIWLAEGRAALKPGEDSVAEHLKIVDAQMVGARVYTRDRADLGTVKEVRGGAFKVNAPARIDYWLSATDVQSATPHQVVLPFIADNLDDHTVHEPTR
jgi:hypothetical protein